MKDKEKLITFDERNTLREKPYFPGPGISQKGQKYQIGAHV